MFLKSYFKPAREHVLGADSAATSEDEKPMNKIKLIVTTAFGLESVVKKELIRHGFENFGVSDGKIEFDADICVIPRLNIGLRAADRVLMKVGEFKAADFDVLFDRTCALPWGDWIPENAKITVTGKSVKSVLKSVRANQSIVKKAIIKKMQAKFHRERFPETGPEFIIQVSVLKDTVQLTLDASGPGLHRRGYRVDTGEVPIRENLAAGLVLLSSWTGDKTLIDPMCGSATILIEAAMIARNMAPGLNRRFAAESWPAIEKKFWKEARASALKAIKPPGNLKIFGYDVDKKRIAGCNVNAKNAGVDKDIIFKQQDIRDLRVGPPGGTIISNPPYGVKMAGARELAGLYTAMNAVFKNKPEWALYIITADKNFPRYFKRGKPDKIRKLYNGTIEANYYQYT